MFSRNGEVVRIDMPVDAYEFPRVSPDGTHIAVGTNDGKEAIIWIYDQEGQTTRRRLTDVGKNRFPVWSNDSRHVAFQSDRDGDLAIFWQLADGTAPAERLTTAAAGTSHLPETWSPHANTLLFSIVKDGSNELWSLSLGDRRSAAVAGITSVTPITPVFSPDGHWLAYHTRGGSALGMAQSDHDTVWVRPFPPTTSRYEVASDGTSHHPFWINSGNELIYVVGAGQVYARRIFLTPNFGLAKPEPLTNLTISTAPPAAEARNFDGLPDGRIVSDADPSLPRRETGSSAAAAAPQLEVVLNWFEELKARVPTGK
jgi:Tol biopolymer transport system component